MRYLISNTGQFNLKKRKKLVRDMVLSANVASISWIIHLTNKKFNKDN